MVSGFDSFDHFMQVKCKFQLTSETESTESIHSNNERVRLCTTLDLDRNSILIVMICSNDTGNNHIVAYYVERRIVQSTTILTKPRIIVKQIYYHKYNEDIVALCLSETGNKLALVSSSSTIYILPIKNILLNLHAKQLRSSQGKSMYFYDASILDCCTLDNPIAVAYWESVESDNKSTVIVASEQGELSFISVEEKKEVNGTYVNERIKYMKIIRDRFSYSLLITCDDFIQYRFALELVKQQQQQDYSNNNPDSLQASSSTHPHHIYTDEYTYLEKDIMPSWDRKPIPIKLHSSTNSMNGGGGSAAAAIRRVLVPSISRSGSQSSLFSSLAPRERSLPLIFYHPQTSTISVVDVLGVHKSPVTNIRVQHSKPRILRFFSSKQFYYRPQKPILVCRLTSLDPDEMITHLVLTDRFLAVATDRDRCLINSRNCCNLRNANSSIELDPIVKEITFSNEEKILLLVKSPVSNDNDNIIDSFLLVTNRSIYSIEARQSCRDMFINLIDAHLGIEPPRHSTKTKKIVSTSLISSGINPNEYTLVDNFTAQRKNSQPNLMVSNFLSHRDEVYERINYDSRAFSILFKLDLNSLYEAYGDKLLLRSQFDLANRFFQMAKFDNTKTLGKYIRLGACIDYNTEPKFLEFITSPEVTKALVKNINLTCEFLAYQQIPIQFRKYSFAALSQFDLFRKLVICQQQQQIECCDSESKLVFTKQQKLSIENIFIEFLNACLDESTEDSCRLWYNYINFYLNYVGTVAELEEDILNLLDSGSCDCRSAITLYKAVGRDENGSVKPFMIDGYVGTPLESMRKLYNLSELFKNEFLLRFLAKTLDLVPQSAVLDTNIFL